MKRHRKARHERRVAPRTRIRSVTVGENRGYDSYDRVAFGYDLGQGGADEVSPTLTPEATDHACA